MSMFLDFAARCTGVAPVVGVARGQALDAQHLLHNLSWLDRWPGADRSTRIVFITEGILRHDLEEMVALLDRVAQRTAAARERARQESQGGG